MATLTTKPTLTDITAENSEAYVDHITMQSVEHKIHDTTARTAINTLNSYVQKVNTDITNINTAVGGIASYGNATKTTSGIVKVGDNIDVNNGEISVPVATTGNAGVVVVGSNLSVDNGTVSVPTGSASVKGVVKTGTNITNTSGTISVADASTSAKGVVKVGSNIAVSSGTISVADGTTKAKGVVMLSDATDSDSSATAATSKAVKNAYDKAAEALTKANGTLSIQSGQYSGTLGTGESKEVVIETNKKPWIVIISSSALFYKLICTRPNTNAGTVENAISASNKFSTNVTWNDTGITFTADGGFYSNGSSSNHTEGFCNEGVTYTWVAICEG